VIVKIAGLFLWLNNSMANKITKFLGNVVGGIFGSDGDMRDFQHAARLFSDNFQALAPKVEFLYHVYFDINQGAKRAPGNFGFAKSEANIEVGMLVKACQVPGVNLNTETKNQYGKKTNIQTQVQYTPVNITFHDDNSNLISGMWQQYFKNYYADSNYSEDLKIQPTYNAPYKWGGGQKSLKQGDYSFGYDNWATFDFFNHISIYQLSRHRFFEYRLINPIITAWQGPNLSSSSSQPAENTMTLIYEGIQYAEGNVSNGNPDGFAQLHYDTTPSPLSLMGGGTASLFGQTGVLAGGLDVFGDIASGNAFADPFSFIGTAIKAKNTVDNANKLTGRGIKSEIESIATGAVTNAITESVKVGGYNKSTNKVTTKASLVESETQTESAIVSSNDTTSERTDTTTTVNR